VKRSGHIRLLILASLMSVAAVAPPKNVRVPFPSSRDIRRIFAPADLTPEDVSNLLPSGEVLRYYIERFRTAQQANGRSYFISESHFISVLPLDFKGMVRFAEKIFGPEQGLKSVDSFMAAMPNLMAYFRQISVGDIKKHVEAVGQFQRVSMEFTLDDRSVERHYPTIAGKMKGHLQSLWLELRNADSDLLLRLDYSSNKARLAFLLDPRGYFVATDPKGNPIPAGARNLGLDNAKRGVKLYIDIGLVSRITLMKILKMMIFEVKRLRAQVDMRLDTNRLDIAWKVTEATPGNIRIAGIDTRPIKESLANYKGNFKGTLTFMPMPAPHRKFTFMRVFDTNEQVDNWLVHIAITTWDELVNQLMNDLSAPISEALAALKKDIRLQTQEP